MRYEYIFLICINALTFLLFGLDKSLSKKRGPRIPEKVLLTLSILGGAFGGFLGMLFFNHKTAKPHFKYTLTILVLVYAIALVYM